MSLLQSATIWFKLNEAFLAASSPYTGAWYNAEAMNAAQFYFKHSGSANTVLSVDLSPVEAHGRDTDSSGNQLLPANIYERVAILTSGDNSAAGFCAPASGSPWDYPFKSFRVYLTTDADITAVYCGLCMNALAGG